MSVYFPQGVCTLRVLLEDFSTKSVRLQKPYVWTVVAKRIAVSLNAYTEADTFRATIDYKNLPFDPRIIRSLGITIHLENKRQIFNLEQGRNVDHIKPTAENIIFQGFADTDRLSLDETERTVTLEGRDLTSLLIDREYLGEPINNSDRLDVVVRKLLDELPQTQVDPSDPSQGLQIELQGITAAELPTLASVADGKGELDGKVNARKKRTYWDKIQELVANAGLIAFVSIDRLVITRPRNLYDRRQSKVFVYGSNVKSMEFERKLGRQKGFNVRVVSTAFEAKGIIEARIPVEATEEWAKETGVLRQEITLPVAKAPGINNPDQGETKTAPDQVEPAPYITFRVANVINKEQLVKIGEKIYEELGRQQIEGKLSTKEMKIFSPESSTPFFDATKFRVGTPIEIRIDQGDLDGLNELLPKTNREQQKFKETPKDIETRRRGIATFLKQRAYRPEVAEALADALTRFDTPFFTKAVEFQLDHENGFSMDLEFINFIEIPKNLVEGQA